MNGTSPRSALGLQSPPVGGRDPRAQKSRRPACAVRTTNTIDLSELSRTVIHLGNCHWTDLRHDPDRGSWRLYAHNVNR